jgi:putative Holliday junction resolvase
LGIDYGDRRIGLAVSDPLRVAAHGLPTLTNTSDEEVRAALRRIIEEREIGEIVVGLPRNMNDTLGPQARRVAVFAESLRVFGLPVHLIDERLTTERARRAMVEAGLSRERQRRKVDRIAAQFILQIHLDLSRKPSPGSPGQPGGNAAKT